MNFTDLTVYSVEKKKNCIMLEYTGPSGKGHARFVETRGGLAWQTDSSPLYALIIGEPLPDRYLANREPEFELLWEKQFSGVGLDEKYSALGDTAALFLCEWYVNWSDKYDANKESFWDWQNLKKQQRGGIVPAPYADSFTVGTEMAASLLHQNKLILPKTSIVYQQLSTITETDLAGSKKSERFFAIEALRHAIGSFIRYPPSRHRDRGHFQYRNHIRKVGCYKKKQGVQKMNENQEYDDENYEDEDDDLYAGYSYEEEPPVEPWDGVSEPQTEQFETWEKYDTARIKHAVRQATNDREPEQDTFQNEKFAAAIRQGIGDLTDPVGDKKVELVRQIQEYADEERRARADGDGMAAFRYAERQAMAIKELESLPPSRVQQAAEADNVREIISMWNNAMQDEDFQTDMVNDARIIRDRLNQISDGNVFAVIRGDSRYGKPLKKVTQDMLWAVEVTPEVAKQLRAAQRNMGDRFNLWDELERRHVVGPRARNDVAHAKISQQDYEAARAASKEDKGFDRSKAASEMSQKEYERWRKAGGGRGR